MPSFVKHLEGAIDGAIVSADGPRTTHEGRPFWTRYDLPAVSQALSKSDLASRPATMWRYRELLPIPSEVEPVSLGEGMTPLLLAPKLGASFGLENLWIKDESRLPTGSFKSRGQAVAISMAHHFGIRRVAIPTAGNAGGAMASYAARAGMEAYVFMPSDTPAINRYEAVLAGAKVFLVDGLITECGRVVREGVDEMGWFDFSTLKEPYRLEGKKTMGLELAEQFEWRLPDVILYPTGGGTGLIGMWKGFGELRELGWLESDRLPRMVAVQSETCAPIARAFAEGARFARPFKGASTIASGIRVPAAIGDFMILDAVRESQGRAVAVRESRIREWMALAARQEGIALCPESAACVGALESLVAEGWIRPHEQVVIFNTGAAQKYIEAMEVEVPRFESLARLREGF